MDIKVVLETRTAFTKEYGIEYSQNYAI